MTNTSRAQPSGVRHVSVTSAEAGQRVDNFLHRHLQGVPKSRVYRMLRKGEVRIDRRRAKPEQRLQLGETVRIPPVTQPGRTAAPVLNERLAQQLASAVLFEDAQLLVLDKPAGLPVHGGSGVALGIIEALRLLRPELPFLELVHRLDRATSGCLLLAKSRPMLTDLHALLRDGQVEKRYQVLVSGQWPWGTRRVEAAVERASERSDARRMAVAREGGKAALTRFVALHHYADASLLAAELYTGRTHQIRVHAAHLGYPVAGDRKYGDFSRNRELQTLGLKRMFLHAAEVRFRGPAKGQAYAVKSPLPADLNTVLQRLPPATT